MGWDKWIIVGSMAFVLALIFGGCGWVLFYRRRHPQPLYLRDIHGIISYDSEVKCRRCQQVLVLQRMQYELEGDLDVFMCHCPGYWERRPWVKAGRSDALIYQRMVTFNQQCGCAWFVRNEEMVHRAECRRAREVK